MKLQRGNAQTRYLDVVPFSCFPDEQERLFLGSTLRIVSISIGHTSFAPFIAALDVFERMMNGYFIDAQPRSTEILLSLIARVVEPSVMETVCQILHNDPVSALLVHQEFDSDALQLDLDDIHNSNICEEIDDAEKTQAIKRILADDITGLYVLIITLTIGWRMI